MGGVGVSLGGTHRLSEADEMRIGSIQVQCRATGRGPPAGGGDDGRRRVWGRSAVRTTPEIEVGRKAHPCENAQERIAGNIIGPISDRPLR